MNCKPGDLAVLIKSEFKPHNIGSVVKILRKAESFNGYFCWETSPVFDGGTWVLDKNLRPIRDQDGQDETLTWAGLPNEKKVNA
jgi:hypothetical protein